MAGYLYGPEKPTCKFILEWGLHLQESNFELKKDGNDCGNSRFSSTLPNILAENVMHDQWSQIENKLSREPHIFVVRYSDRVDLLRVMLIGAKGTPYHHGLYFFDFYIHSDFPAEPPKVRALWCHENRYSPDNWDEVENVCGVNNVPRGINLMIDYLSECLKGTESRAHNTREYFYRTVCMIIGMIYVPPIYFHNVVYQHFKHHEKSIMYEFMAYYTGNFEVGKYEEKTGVLDEEVNRILKSSDSQYFFETLPKALEYNLLGLYVSLQKQDEYNLLRRQANYTKAEKKWEWAEVCKSCIKELKDNAKCTFKFLDDDDDGEDN